MNDKKEKKKIVITGTKVVFFVSILAAIFMVIMIVTNFIGITDMDWFTICLGFAPLVTTLIVTKMKKK